MHYDDIKKKIFQTNLLGVMIGVMVFLAPFILYYWAYTTETYYENIPKFHGIHKDASNVSYFESIKKGKLIYECDLPLESFLNKAKVENWEVKEIKDLPIRMIRYRYGITTPETFNKDRLELFHESKTSCFHFVKQGYYYIDESKRQFIHVAYDTLNGKMYVYKNFGREEFTMKYINAE